MFSRTIFRQFRACSPCLKLLKLPSKANVCFANVVKTHRRNVSTTCIVHNQNSKKKGDTKAVAIRDTFLDIENKNKDTYLDMVKIFEERDIHRRGHVEFIYSALKHMESFGVHKDLEVYKALIDVLPKGKFIPQNMFQAEFMHYPKQQQCAIDLLEQMENNGVIPDFEVEDILMNIFGRKGHPLRKFWRMMYWMPKFKNLSPWPLPNPVPNDIFELARLAIERITSVDAHTKIQVYQTADIADSVDDTWIVSGQSPLQKELLAKHKKDAPVYVEGGFRVWIRDKAVSYFTLRADPNPDLQHPPVEPDPDDVSFIKIPFLNARPKAEGRVRLKASVHEQEEGTILACCATGSSSKDSLLSWIRHLEKDGNAVLADIPVLFTLRSEPNELAVAGTDANAAGTNEEKEKIEEK